MWKRKSIFFFSKHWRKMMGSSADHPCRHWRKWWDRRVFHSYQRKKRTDQNKKYMFSSKAVTWRKKMGQSADQKDRPRTWKMWNCRTRTVRRYWKIWTEKKTFVNIGRKQIRYGRVTCQQLTINYWETRTCQIDCFPTISATTTNLEIGPRAD